MKKILIAASEAMPFAATGGLGDVMGSLPAALVAADPDCDVRVVLPYYDAVGEEYRAQMRLEAEFEVPLAWRRQYCGVWSLKKDGVTYYFLDNAYYFRRGALYGAYDDGERFAYFCRAGMELMAQLDFFPDILHANDWQSALMVLYCKCKFAHDPRYAAIRTVFTIHNVEYQGQYDFAIYGDVFDLEDVDRSIVDLDGAVNLMKGAICVCDVVSTVSPRYAQELCDAAVSRRLCPILQENSHKLCGILNGIDYVYYDPAKDTALPQNYTWRSASRKQKNKTALQAELGLDVDESVPMLAIISRLASHKGLDLIQRQAYHLLWEKKLQIVVLGCGEPQYEAFFRKLQEDFPSRVAACICYDRELSRKIYAACDLFLMPSKSEPCGLSQMIASRYGAIPIVRETGGLADSIAPYYEQDGALMGNGFTFFEYNSGVMYERVCAAIDLWNDAEKRAAYVKKIMRTDFSWQASAKKYLQMYAALL